MKFSFHILEFMKLLNIGCGLNFHHDWVNIDIVSASSEVLKHDIRKGIPYPNSYFDACYSSHVLEHLVQQDAEKLVIECFRVLKPKGIARIVVPDLERIAKDYLYTLEQVESGDTGIEPNYDWMMLELYDQVIRTVAGGEMAHFLNNPNLQNKDYILSRVGHEAENIWQNATLESPTIWQKLRSTRLPVLLQKLREEIAKTIVRLTVGEEAKKALSQGMFRNSGEIHQWMYDRFSLRRLLVKSGFIDIKICQADESQINGFSQYALDVFNGKILKPDSLYVEGIKP